MSLIETIESDLTDALKSGDTFTKDTLRFLKSVLKNAEIDSTTDLTDDQVTAIIQKEVKKRLEAETLFNQAGKPELAANEAAEVVVLKKYLPEQMDEAAITTIVTDYLTDNPTEMNQMGTAMGALSAQLKGQADMGIVSKILREKIQNG